MSQLSIDTAMLMYMIQHLIVSAVNINGGVHVLDITIDCSTVNLRRDVMYMMQQLLMMASNVMYTLNKLTSSTVDITRAVMCSITHWFFQMLIYTEEVNIFNNEWIGSTVKLNSDVGYTWNKLLVSIVYVIMGIMYVAI